MSDWITDRLPTEGDADPDGKVIIRHDGLLHQPHVCFRDVTAHCNWQHTPFWRPPLPTIKVGQKWRRADGVEVKVFRDDGSANAPLVIGRTREDAFWYKRNGMTAYVRDISMRLVELIQDAPEEIQSPAAEPAAEPAPATTPRRFVSISRTIWLDQCGIQLDYIDAVADDGTAWWMGPHEIVWHQRSALPARELPTKPEF